MKNSTYHHINLKNELIEKGIDLVNKYGVEQLSLRKVAQVCNVSHSAPYSHFKNKDELISVMQKYITDQFAEKLLNTVSLYSNQSNFLLEFGKTYILFFLENPQYFSFLFTQNSISIDLDINSFTEENYKPFLIYKEQLLKQLASLNISDEKKQNYIISLFAYIHGITSLATMENVKHTFDWSKKLDDLICLFSIEG